MLRITNIKIPVARVDVDLYILVSKKIHVVREEILNIHIFKKSLDARKGKEACVVYTLDVEVVAKREAEVLEKGFDNVTKCSSNEYVSVKHGFSKLKRRPLVVGFGPAGMFAALILAQEGYNPIIIERGSMIEKRIEKVESFWKDGILDEACNVQFGEGGAGTFSDGKLTTRVKDDRIHKVLAELVKAGANENIKFDNNPHVGTDKIRDIVKNIREEIKTLGGTFHFDTNVEDFIIENNKVIGVMTKKGLMHSNNIIIAIGHSSRDTYNNLFDHNVSMEAKSFAVGLRIEHKQALINKNQYKDIKDYSKLEPATYRLTHNASNGRGVYSFCMCPGGIVVPSSSSVGCVVTNGMSFSGRDEENANAAILVQVTPDDFGPNVLDGIKYQETLEKKAYALSMNTYKAPCQLAVDYIMNKPTTALSDVLPSYYLGVELCDLNDLLPPNINKALKEALMEFDKKIPSYISTGLLSGVETRSSSPVRIIRNDKLQSVNISGLYPCGEGAGYAGGIVSAAIDGIKIAESIVSEYMNFADDLVIQEKKASHRLEINKNKVNI